MPRLILTPAEMSKADAAAIAAGTPGIVLMERAGAAVASVALQRFGGAAGFDVLAGPGNNGGDAYVAACLLAEAGADVSLFAMGEPRDGSDAALAAQRCHLPRRRLADWRPDPARTVIDGLFGAGLSRPLDGDAARVAAAATGAGCKILAIDVPSGLDGATGVATGTSFAADVTVTFAALKPGHVLSSGPDACGAIVVADIGVTAADLASAGARCFVNEPDLWREKLPSTGRDAHKYSRGHVAVFSGGPTATGAARLAAIAAARSGAGAVTVLSPGNALTVNAAHLTSIMLARCDSAEDALSFIAGRKVGALVIGPGYGRGPNTCDMVGAVLSSSVPAVLDADALTSFDADPEALFAACRANRSMPILTPHEGEFRRVFADLADMPSRLERARRAAERAGAVIVSKGPDTVIAAPDGRAAINVNGSRWLATAGSGDTLAGIAAGLRAQDMPAWEAACAAVWIHAEAGRRFGPGLIAEDLAGQLPPILRELFPSTF